MRFFETGTKWRGLLLASVLGALVLAGIVLLPDADAQGQGDQLVVTSSDPADGASVTTFPTTIALTFNFSIFDVGQASSLRVNGFPALGVTQTAPDTLTYDIDPLADAGPGTSLVLLDGGAVFGGAEVGNEPYQGSFTLAPLGSITVEKIVDGFPTAQQFDFQLDGATAGSIAAGETFTLSDLPPGTYSVTEIVPAGWGLQPVECTSQSTTETTNGVEIMIQAGDDVTCTFTNFSSIVCASKRLGPRAGQFFSISDFPFSMQSAMAPVDPIEGIQSCEGTAFRISPGAQFQLSETIALEDAPFVGFSSGDCQSGQSPSVPIIDGTITTTAPEDGSQVNCEFFNDSVSVCVVKEFGPAAQDLSASVTDFGFRLNGGTAETPGPSCADVPAVEFLVAPNTGFTISEVLPQGSPIGPTDIVCTADGGQDLLVDGADGLVVGSGQVGTADLVAGSISISAGEVQEGSVFCTFTNDSVPVCVTKQQGPGLIQRGLDPSADPAPWIFEVLQLMTPVPSADVPGCNGTGFYVIPNTTFKVSEAILESLSSEIALTAAPTCTHRGEVQVTGDEQGVVTMDGGTTGDVDCSFTNDTVLVCVTKAIGGTAEDLGVNVSPADYQFTYSSTSGVSGTAVPAADVPECATQNGFAFYTAPGSTVTINETATGDAVGAPIGPDFINCLTSSPSDGQPNFLASIPGDLQQGSVTAALGEATKADCNFINDAVLVCVTKDLGLGAQIAQASATNFQFSIDSGTTTAPPNTDQCGQDNAAAIPVAPFTGFTLTEVVPAGSPYRAVNGDCVSEDGTFDLNADGEIVVLAPSTTDVINCSVTNDVVVVCVTKEIDANVAAQSKPAADFVIEVNVDGQDPLPVTLGASSVCDDDDQDPNTAVGVVLLPPGTAFSISEQDPGATIGLTNAECATPGGEGGPIAWGTFDPASRSVLGIDFGNQDISRVNCTFDNGSVLVCVQKQFGTTAAEAGFTTPGTFDVTANGTIVLDDVAAEPIDEDSQDDPCGYGGARGIRAFYVAPESAITVTENLAATSPLGLVSSDCRVNSEVPQSSTLTDATVSLQLPSDVNRLDCELQNDVVTVCVTKRLSSGAIDAGYGLSDFSFQLAVDGTVVGEPLVPAAVTDDSLCTSDQEGAGTAAFVLAPGGSEYSVTEIIGDGVRAGVGSATCESTSTFGELTVSFSPAADDDSRFYECDFLNLSVPITINKTVINDNLGALTVADFLFDVFDSDGQLIATVSDPDPGSAGAIVYVAPGTTFTVTERTVDGYDLTAAACAQTSSDQALASASVTYALGEFELSTECTFVNDDIAPIPVCAMLILEEGDSAFTLADFSLELFKDGAIVGQRTADAAFDADCEDATTTTADLLPSNLVKLGDVFADGSSFSFVAAAADPDGLLEFDPSSCTVDSPALAQALAGPDPVVFTADVGATRVVCVARASARAPQRAASTGGSRPTFIAEEPAAAPAQPTAAPAQVVSTAIAVTGSSTTGVTLPAAFALLAAGFLGLGTDRLRRRRLRH